MASMFKLPLLASSASASTSKSAVPNVFAAFKPRSFSTRPALPTPPKFNTHIRQYARYTGQPVGRGGSTTHSLMSAPAKSFSEQGGWQKVAVTAGVVAAGVVGINVIFNRETRDGFSLREQNLLHSTFMYTGIGLAVTATSAYMMHKRGVSVALMKANPWLVAGGGLVASIGTMMWTFKTDPNNSGMKHTAFLAFQLAQSVTLAPLYFFAPAILARAAFYTVGIVGSLAFVGATAKEDKYLYLGGPLLVGLTVVCLSSLAPLVLPVTAVRTLAITENLALYGGLAVFSGMILYDTQKVLAHARMGANDPINESIGLELDAINIFIRMVQILAMQQGGNRRK